MTVSSEPKRRSSSNCSEIVGTESIAANLFEELENVYLKRRREIVTEEGFLNTPLHVLKKMVEDNKTSMHSEMVIINHLGDGIQLWRVELFVGNFRGTYSLNRLFAHLKLKINYVVIYHFQELASLLDEICHSKLQR